MSLLVPFTMAQISVGATDGEPSNTALQVALSIASIWTSRSFTGNCHLSIISEAAPRSGINAPTSLSNGLHNAPQPVAVSLTPSLTNFLSAAGSATVMTLGLGIGV